MKKSSRAAQITEDYILEKFMDLMDSDAAWAVKVKGLELLGKYLNMFQDSKKVDVNYTLKSLVTSATMEDLQKIVGGVPERYLDVRSADCMETVE